MGATQFLLFFDPHGASDVERLVDDARAAALCDTAARAQEAGFRDVVLVTSSPDRFSRLPGVEIEATPAGGDFAGRLHAIVARRRPAAVCYAGAGMPAMTADRWAGILDRLRSGEATVTNNLYSSDVLATTAVEALAALPSGTPDNGMALFLRDSAALAVDVLPRSAATLLDIDTPAELLILSLGTELASLHIGPALRAVLQAAPHQALLDNRRLADALDRLTERETQVLVVGRVGSGVWQALEQETAARVRVISEERGMRTALSREARSILGFHADAAGPGALVDALSELADAVFMDTRPFLRHVGWDASRADRFRADLARWDTITQPHLRTFSHAVAEARVPIVLGGHALVSGGLLAAIDIAWSRWEVRRERRPPHSR